MIFLVARERKLAKTRGNPVQTQQRPLQTARYSKYNKYNTCIQSTQCGKRPSDVCFLLFASAPSCLSPGVTSNILHREGPHQQHHCPYIIPCLHRVCTAFLVRHFRHAPSRLLTTILLTSMPVHQLGHIACLRELQDLSRP